MAREKEREQGRRGGRRGSGFPTAPDYILEILQASLSSLSPIPSLPHPNHVPDNRSRLISSARLSASALASASAACACARRAACGSLSLLTLLSHLSLSLSLPLPLPLFLFYPLLFAACLPSYRSQSFSPTPLHPPRSCSLCQQLYPLIFLSDTLTPSLFLSISPHPHQSSLPAHACSP